MRIRRSKKRTVSDNGKALSRRCLRAGERTSPKPEIYPNIERRTYMPATVIDGKALAAATKAEAAEKVEALTAAAKEIVK